MICLKMPGTDFILSWILKNHVQALEFTQYKLPINLFQIKWLVGGSSADICRLTSSKFCRFCRRFCRRQASIRPAKRLARCRLYFFFREMDTIWLILPPYLLRTTTFLLTVCLRNIGAAFEKGSIKRKELTFLGAKFFRIEKPQIGKGRKNILQSCQPCQWICTLWNLCYHNFLHLICCPEHFCRRRKKMQFVYVRLELNMEADGLNPQYLMWTTLLSDYAGAYADIRPGSVFAGFTFSSVAAHWISFITQLKMWH